MRFRYRDNRGKVIALADVASLLRAIREGSVTPDTRLAVGDEKTFQRAELVVAYQQAAAAVSRTGGIPAAAVGARTVPWHARRGLRIGAAIVGVAMMGVFASLRLQTIGREHARQSVAASQAGPSNHTRNALTRIAAEFGDSAAVAQHRLEDWVDHQRFPDRFRGSALHGVPSLRGARAAAAQYRMAADSLLLRSRGFAVMLVQRADSAESADTALNGLMSSAEDLLVEWQRELTTYADIQRTAASLIDSLAAFVLDHQQSFAIREGKPVFLSRADAARFQELAANLGVLAGREKAWADALRERRPEWMATLAEGDRPRFGRNLLSGPASN
ncbi:MAG TPA: hypothetical protein VFU23_06860 [Gemmatimonadales bacterium]|nr:hypothetical protein [Gemmatimonadales bacterium]